MSDIALSVENISKMYRLGEVGTGTLSHDLNRWWSRIRGKEDPFAQVGTINDRTQKAQKGEHVWALKDINFEVKQGEVLGIIGKNGAGKSTLLKVISSITAPTKGEIKFNGRIASLLEVGTGMHPELTGKENVFLNGAILGMTKAEIRAKFDDIMDFAGCAKYADTPVKRYSSGMKVRLGFAVAAFLEPEILIVDEVLAVGDAEFQKRAIGKMKEVSQGGGRTVLFVSHNMASVSNLCDTAILLGNGKIEFHGVTNEVITEYLRGGSNNYIEALAKRKDRKGNGLVLVQNVMVLDEKRNSLNYVMNGQNVHFRIDLLNKSIKTLRNVQIDIGLYNIHSLKITHFSTNLAANTISSISPARSSIYFSIKKIPLLTGTYFLNIRIMLDQELLDWIPNAYSFEVIDGNFFNSGKSYNDEGFILVSHSVVSNL